MEQLFLMPGEERCERFKDGNGIPRVHYSYRSMHGAFFDCESRSLEEAQRLCEDWLWGDRIFEKCGIGRDEGGDGGKTLEIRGKRRLSARDGGANYQQS